MNPLQQATLRLALSATLLQQVCQEFQHSTACLSVLQRSSVSLAAADTPAPPRCRLAQLLRTAGPRPRDSHCLLTSVAGRCVRELQHCMVL
jgi:hypothetical protein